MGLERIAQSFLRYVAFSALCFAINPPAKAQTVDAPAATGARKQRWTEKSSLALRRR